MIETVAEFAAIAGTWPAIPGILLVSLLVACGLSILIEWVTRP